jgi:hypothetical protein
MNFFCVLLNYFDGVFRFDVIYKHQIKNVRKIERKVSMVDDVLRISIFITMIVELKHEHCQKSNSKLSK